MDNNDSRTEKYLVTGMSCAACQAHVEKAVNGVEGVSSCSVSLLTNSMSVSGSADPQAVIKAVEDAGYGASLEGGGGKAKGQIFESMEEQLGNKEIPLLKKRLISSVIFLLVLMYFSMGVSMWGWPAPEFLEHNMVGIGIIEMLLSGIVMVINNKFFVNGFKALIHKSTNMDTLVALGSFASFAYSVVALLAMTGVSGDMDAMMAYHEDFYFESAAMILALITVGKMLEARSKGKTTDALKGLMQLAPRTATVLRDGAETTIPASDILLGEIFVVRPGEQIPVDGVVIEGNEKVKSFTTEGNTIILQVRTDSGEVWYITRRDIRADDTKYVQVTAADVTERYRIIDELEKALLELRRRFPNVVIELVLVMSRRGYIEDKWRSVSPGIAVVTALVWLALGADMGFAVARGVSVLVISCPCALGLATPVAIMAGSGVGAKNGILFNTAAALEMLGRTEIVALDKTGTITRGEPEVTGLYPAADAQENELLRVALALEAKSEHPLSRAVLRYAEKTGLSPETTENFEALAGRGLTATLSGQKIFGGSRDFIAETLAMPEALSERADALAGEGKTPLFFATEEKILGFIAVADVIKEDSRRAVEDLRGMGVRTVMLTGDNQRTAEAVGREAAARDRGAGKRRPGFAGERQDRDGRRRDQRRARFDAGRRGRRHRRGSGRSRGRGGRGADEEPLGRRRGGGSSVPGNAQKYQGKSILGVRLQSRRHPAGGGRIHPADGLETDAHVRRGGHEPVELLRRYQRPAAEFFPAVRR